MSQGDVRPSERAERLDCRGANARGGVFLHAIAAPTVSGRKGHRAWRGSRSRPCTGAVTARAQRRWASSQGRVQRAAGTVASRCTGDKASIRRRRTAGLPSAAGWQCARPSGWASSRRRPPAVRSSAAARTAAPGGSGDRLPQKTYRLGNANTLAVRPRAQRAQDARRHLGVCSARPTHRRAQLADRQDNYRSRIMCSSFLASLAFVFTSYALLFSPLAQRPSCSWLLG